MRTPDEALDVPRPLATLLRGRVPRLLVALVLAALAAAGVPALAHAVVYVQDDEYPVANSGPGAFGPAGLAVNQTTGDIYVGLPIFTDGIERFNSAGASQGTFATGVSGASAAVAPVGSTSEGNVFVFDAGFQDGTPDIHTFSATGTPIGSPFAVDYSAPDPQLLPQIATLSDVIFYPNPDDDVVNLLDATGGDLGSFVGSGAAALVDPTGVGVDSSFNTYVVDTAGGGRVVKFSNFGGISGVMPATTGAVSVAVDQVSGDVFVGMGSGAAFHIVVFDSTGAQIGDFGAGDFGDGNIFQRQIAVESSTGRVFVTDSAPSPPDQAKRVVVYKEGAPPPVVTTMTASDVDRTTAKLLGTVTPGVGEVADCHFEYTDQADFDANSFANATHAPCTSQYPSSGAALVLATTSVSQLDPDTSYRFRLVASNEDGGAEGAAQAFDTLPNPPTVATGAATDVQQAKATVGGSVNPNGGLVTTCEIEYGTTSDYGRTKPCSSLPGDGTSPTAVGTTLGGLAPDTTYHFRVRAANAGGAGQGSDQTLTTAAKPDPCAVSPASCVPTDQCVVTPAACKPVTATKATLPATAAVRAGRARIELSCKGSAGATCKGTLRLRARIKRAGKKARTLTIGTARYELVAGKSTVLRVSLSRAARNRLASKGTLRARASGAGISTRSVMLERRRPG